MSWPIVMVPITNSDDRVPREALRAEDDVTNVFAYLDYWQSVIEHPPVILAINKALIAALGDSAKLDPLEIKMTFNPRQGAAFVHELPKLYAPELKLQIRFELL